jgi:citrate lyase beta subunit
LVIEGFAAGLERGTASGSGGGKRVDIPVYNRAKALLDLSRAMDEQEQRKAPAIGRRA